jgi:uncharacterized repeat protein (TIGR01451 family)
VSEVTFSGADEADEGDDSATISFRITSVGNDVDGDGIPDNLEVFGIRDAAGVVVANLAAMGASPLRKDVFVEIDCMESDGNGNGYSPLDAADHSHCPDEAALVAVIQAFARAPVANLDGTQGVQLHLDVGNLYGPANVFIAGPNGAVGSYGDFGSGGSRIPEAGNTILDWDGATGRAGTNFHTLKATNFNAARALAFRYAIFGHQTNFRRAVNDCTGGWAEGTPGNDFMVTLGGRNAATPSAPCFGVDPNGFSVGTVNEQAGTFMHELGHILGLEHGGNDGINRKPNYLSVMSYAFQPCSVPASAAGGVPGGCDYSRIGPEPGGMNDLDETELDECAGIGGNLGFGGNNWNGDTVFEGPTCAAPNNTKGGVADTNNDGVCITLGTNGTSDSAVVFDDILTPPAVPVSINDGPDRFCDTPAVTDDVQVTAVNVTPIQPSLLKSFNDWAGLKFEFLHLANFQPGVSSPGTDEADSDMIRAARQYLSLVTAPDLAFAISGPATILPGQTVTWTTSLRNVGRGPALKVFLTETPPVGGPLAPLDLDTVVAGEEATKDTVYSVPADACPMDLVDSARVTFADMASEEFAKTARAVTRVLDIVPPTLTLSLSETTLWPPNHRLVDIAAAITVTDNCDPNPTVRLVSITSNEPDNGLGDGDTSGDIQGAAFGTDDRQFRLRAERSGAGSGRVYIVLYEARDAGGNTTQGQATVRVPHSK